MGVLLMEYEYQRAKQAVNVDELKGIRLNDQLKRYTKRISNIESIFSKEKSAIESKFSNMASSISSQISQASLTNFSTFSLGNLGISSQYLQGIDANQLVSSALTGTKDNGQSDAANKLAASQTAAAQMKAQIQTILDALKEATIEALEAKEDKQKEPIAAKDAELESDVAAYDTMTELDKQRIDAAKSRLSEDHTSELQSPDHLVCRLLLEKKKNIQHIA